MEMMVLRWRLGRKQTTGVVYIAKAKVTILGIERRHVLIFFNGIGDCKTDVEEECVWKRGGGG